MALEWTMKDPVQLPEPVFSTPTPAQGCDVCASLERQFDKAADPRLPEFDPSKATDCLVEIKRHPHGGQT
ncbi:hypothetical protein [Streptomyces chryseus]|uniref:hypothetical protein n=1 Tax=Streptomyces chryseus TaxID=68186 RepID=UPI0019BF04F1|nr:hypothetical protein [Streptomyces chryseus]GGX26537.1 hypothetical protein GCM10010353_46960 [Streptomyces chryseus]